MATTGSVTTTSRLRLQWASSEHLLIKIYEAIHQRHIEGFPEGCSTVGGVTGFIDETTIIYVDAEVLDIYADAGIKFNLTKCRFLVPQGRSFHPRMPGWHSIL